MNCLIENEINAQVMRLVYLNQRSLLLELKYGFASCLDFAGSDVDPDVGVVDVEERLDRVERLLGAVGRVRVPVGLTDAMTAHGVHDVVNLRGSESEAGGGDGSLGHPGVVRGVVLLHGVRRDLRLLLPGVGLAADDDDGTIGYGHGGFVAAGRRHLSLLGP